MTDASRRAGPRREALRRRRMARRGLVVPDLPVRAVNVNGVARTYVAVPASGPASTAPLLLVLHGAGGTGLGMAALTGLHTRGPAAGCAVVFPDGVAHVWNDQRGASRLRSREGVDDVAFLQALVGEGRRTGLSDGRRVFALGMSNGGLMSEHVARHGLLELEGVVVVASSAAVRSRLARPVPAQRSRFLAFHGTADPLVPYGGGSIGPLGRLVGRRSGDAGRGSVAPVEEVAADWSFNPDPASTPVHVDTVAGPADGLRTERLTWPAGPDGAAPVLYRVVGGGHTWPGGAAYLPERIIGRVARHLDATGLALEFVLEGGATR